MMTIPHCETPLRKMALQDVRRRNLRALIKQWGGPSTLAKKLQHSGPSYLSQLVSGNRPVTEKTARAIEAALDLPTGWLDEEPETRTNSQFRVDTELLGRVMATVNELLEELSASVNAEKMAEIVSLVYEDAQAKRDVDEGFANRIVKLATKG